MTVIDFYTHVNNPLEIIVRLVGKAYAQHGRVRVLTEDEAMTAALDQRLWIDPPHAFLPHCRLSSPLAAETPILIDHLAEHEGPAAVLINTQTALPPFFSRFERLAEVVGCDETALAEGRRRYRFYQERGYELRAHNLAAHR
ncbi:MAG: DNA polymerase III subunit chi [Proteobacteria bacterium]|nr:DNA polymerase III subunit chi [Pseudomonadota bacterium]MCL2307601.1 DNA polymerase III subunit chi [Pseudomonadota bacterium]